MSSFSQARSESRAAWPFTSSHQHVGLRYPLIRPPFAPCSRRRTRYATPAIGTWTAALIFFVYFIHAYSNSILLFLQAHPLASHGTLDQSPKMTAHFLALGMFRRRTRKHTAMTCMCCQHMELFTETFSHNAVVTLSSQPIK
jgi:hypothetical protein